MRHRKTLSKTCRIGMLIGGIIVALTSFWLSVELIKTDTQISTQENKERYNNKKIDEQLENNSKKENLIEDKQKFYFAVFLSSLGCIVAVMSFYLQGRRANNSNIPEHFEVTNAKNKRQSSKLYFIPLLLLIIGIFISVLYAISR